MGGKEGCYIIYSAGEGTANSAKSSLWPVYVISCNEVQPRAFLYVVLMLLSCWDGRAELSTREPMDCAA